MGFLSSLFSSEKDTVQNGSACVLIDFENFALGMRDSFPDDPLDLGVLINLGKKLAPNGRVDLSRSYADWRHFKYFTEHMVSLNIQAIQAPSYRLQGRNGTDIQMAVDAINLMHLHPDIHTYILATGDSDFNALVMALQEKGKHVVGVGVEGSISSFFENVCDEFYRFGELANLRKKDVSKDADSPKPQGSQPQTNRKQNSGLKKAKTSISSKVQSFTRKKQTTASAQSSTKKETPRRENPDEPLAPGDPIRSYLDQINLDPKQLIPAHRMKGILALVGESLEQATPGNSRELALALRKRYPDKIDGNDSKKIAAILDSVGLFNRNNDFTWLITNRKDAESLLDGMLASFEKRMKQQTRGESVDPEILSRIFFGDPSFKAEVRVRLSRGKQMIEVQ